MLSWRAGYATFSHSLSTVCAGDIELAGISIHSRIFVSARGISMNRKIVLTLAAALAAGTWMWSNQMASVSAQEKPRVAKYQSGEEKAPSGDIKQAELDYAKALLKVAQADLAKVKEANSKVPDTIPNSVVRSLEYEVAEAAGRIKAMSGGKEGDMDSPYAALAKQSLDFAEQSLKQAQDANARAPGAVSPAEVQRRQADVDVARARLQMANLLSNASASDVMEWQLLQMMADVHDLRQQVRLLQQRN
jgi:hypothetical protein